jgi:hypothetical protein
MPTPNWNLPSGIPRCVYADSLYRTGQVIFSNLHEATPDMVAAAQESLALYHTELAAKLRKHPMHYGALVGSHLCLDAVYQEAVALFRGRLAVTIQPQPQPVPPRRRPPRSPDEVVNDNASLADEVKQPGDTYLGEERKDETTPGGNR